MEAAKNLYLFFGRGGGLRVMLQYFIFYGGKHNIRICLRWFNQYEVGFSRGQEKFKNISKSGGGDQNFVAEGPRY